jgi:galactonate dehydratase
LLSSRGLRSGGLDQPGKGTSNIEIRASGVRQIADYAQLSRTPVGLHSGPCSLVHFYASVHLSGAIENFFKIENALGAFRGFVETMAAGNEPQIRNGVMQFPTGPGLGLELNEDYLKKHMAKGETWWGRATPLE